MNKLKWLEIDRFRNLNPGTRLEFDEGINVLLGKNGSGKTNLLHLLSMVLRFDFRDLAGEEFEVRYLVARADPQDYEVEVALSAQRSPIKSRDFGERVEPEPPPVEIELAARFTTPAGRDISLVSTQGEAVLRSGQVTEQVSPALAPGLSGVPLALIAASSLFERLPRYLLWSMQRPPYRFDEGLLAFRAMHGKSAAVKSVLSSPAATSIEATAYQSPGVSPVEGWLDTYCPFELLRFATAGSTTAPELLESLGRPGNGVPFLDKLAELLGLAHVRWEPRVRERRQNGDEQRATYTEFSFGCYTKDGAYWTDERLSFGQKRLLSFFYYLAVSTEFAVADELVNGFHHDWIAEAVTAIGKRQAFLTSQNPLLLDHLGPESVEQARAMFVRCSITDDGHWEWRNFTQGEAEGLFGDLDACVEHVSEILRRRGLW